MDTEIKRLPGAKLFVKPFGRLDLDNAMEFGTTVNDELDDIIELIMDFSEVTFISSFGLKVVLELYKQMKSQGGMKLTNVPDKIMESFKMVGFDKFLVIE